MKTSLLFTVPEEKERIDIVFDLSIDRSVSFFCKDDKKSEYFMSVLSHPLKKVENILYRQNILNDFTEFPSLFEELKTIFLRYDKMKSDWIELRSAAHVSPSSSSEALLEYTYSSLKITSIFPKTILSFYNSIYDAISKYDISSEGLMEIRNYCEKMIKNKSLEEITEISSFFQYNTPDDFSFDAILNISEDLSINCCDICNITDVPNKRKHEKMQRNFEKKLSASDADNVNRQNISSMLSIFNEKKDTNEKNTVADINREGYDDVMYILTEALHRIDKVLVEITNDVYDVFGGLSQEMIFYDVALQYCSYVTEAGVPLLLPNVLPAENDLIDIVGLRDLFLISEGMKNEEIIANDITVGRNFSGILIRGENNTGKTVFLRSVGIAQVFAQAGLPICAASASLSIRNGIFSHFSASEEDFSPGDVAGRFEGEVRAINDIVENIKPFSLVLLNETFQTTSYSEGTEGIYNILSFLSKVKTKFIFVTHLLRLFEICDKNKILMFQTQSFKEGEQCHSSKDKYKIKTVK